MNDSQVLDIYEMTNDKNTFICGWPVKHSRSPIIHNHWLDRYQISGSYVKLAIEPGNLAKLIQRLRNGELTGGNLTIPHKEAIIPHLDRLEPAARTIGAVNTVWMDGDRLCGDNTDWFGFLANLDAQAPGWDTPQKQQSQAIVLGAGGATRAVIYALLKRGVGKIILANRTGEKAKRLVAEFGGALEYVPMSGIANCFEETFLLVNTTSLGMSGASEFDPAFLGSLADLPKSAVICDLVYVPLQTSLLKRAAKYGLKTVDGLGMLLFQAAPGFERWYGIKPEVDETLRNLIIDDLVKADR